MTTSATLQNINADEFNEKVINGKGLALVDFWAEWCGPCRMLTPTLEQVQSDMGDQVTIYKVNIEENPDIAAQYRIQNIPFMLLFKDGQQADQMMGNQPQKNIQEMIKRNQ